MRQEIETNRQWNDFVFAILTIPETGSSSLYQSTDTKL